MSRPLNSQSFIREDSSTITSLEECGRQEVKEFLDYCQLSQYLECFLSEGFDTLGSVYEIMEEDMIVMGVKRGHRRLIQREIATAKGIPLDQPLIINSIKTRHPIGYTVNRNSSSKMVLDGSIGSILKPNLPVKVELNNENTSSSSSSSNINSGYGSMSSTQKSRMPNMMISQENMIEDDGPSKRAHDSLPRVSDPTRGSSVSSNDEDSTCAGDSQPPKRTYRRHPRQDKNAPVKPPSAYIMFSNHARTELKDQNLTFSELAKIVGDRWKNLSFAEKQEYERTAMRAKDEYSAQFDRYRRTPEYKSHQEYLKEFKSAQFAVSRMVSRTRKRSKPESPNR
ncbi:hypothetical protein J3Q64DRAFT_1643871 [Phycomyces blakesleeanus]|uniref:HMG box domain-containing protein n=1 Tax=Phycomyces blakesleeanus TaxID=4837 RepID=A0ABR3ASV7_PHYBL